MRGGGLLPVQIYQYPDIVDFGQDRPQWHGNRKFDAAPQPVEQGTKPPAPCPPIPASSASKSKIKAFQFYDAPEQDSDQGIGEENHSPDNPPIMAASQLMPGPPIPSQHSQHKECPQTPVGRLPLAELIADGDDNANQNLDLTPIERVLWHHVPGSSQLSSSQPASTSKQGRKRARSSSPASSSPNEASSHLPNKKPSLDLQTWPKTLETPQADPAGDLWSRYALKTGGGRDGSPTRNESIFADLLRSSSPQTPGSHLKTRELGTLRRSISCANEWPASATKRRRLNNSGSQNQALNDRHSMENTENAKLSRVSLLVEQVQNALRRSRAGNVEAKKDLESSTPPDEGAIVNHSQSSPTHNVQVDSDQKLERLSSTYSSSAPRADLQAAQNDCLRDPERTSEFEDDDFDDDELLEVVHASLVPEQPTDTRVINNVGLGPAIQTSGETIPAYSKPPVPPKAQWEPTHSGNRSGRLDSTTGRSQAPGILKDSPLLHDDFEEDDDDMSAADLENLVAAYDQQPQAPPLKGQRASIPPNIVRKPLSERDGTNTSRTSIKTSVAPKAAKVIEVSSDEEFGEDADFDDIVAQCEGASQPAAQSVSRYQIINVVEGEYQTDRGRWHPEKATNDTNEAQIYGHILHEIFQEAMKANRWDDDWLQKVVEDTVSRYLESFFEINIDPLVAIEQLKGKSAALQSWAEIYVAAKPKPEAVIKDRNGTTSILSVNKLLEVEEKVWSPMYGLKGNVDASIQITTNDGSGEKVLTVPFELKTGKNANAAHKAQTALYTLLLSDRYGSCSAVKDLG
ncbi:MAG: hypothetical protein Q9196_002197 [Gyalolechia fulgens]